MVRSWILVITGFNAVTALAGGITLIFGVFTPPLSVLEDSTFASFVLPGAVLAVLVGGTFLAAFWAELAGGYEGPVLTMVSGLVMIGWITGELILTTGLSWLQPLYLVTGAAAFVLGWFDWRHVGIEHLAMHR